MSKKNKKLAHKQAKQKRSGAQSHRDKQRKAVRWPAPLLGLDRELAEDVLPIFGGKDEAGLPINAAGEYLLNIVVDSGELADEPELADVFFQPIEAAEMFVTVANEKGIHPESFDEMPEDEREDKRLEIMAESAHRLLTDEMRQTVVARLNELRLRLKRSGEKMKVVRAATLQWFLNADELEALWLASGLLLAICARSVDAGFKLIEASLSVLDDSDKTGRGLQERLVNSPLFKVADALLAKMPGMRHYLEREVDKAWDAAEHAIFEGELYLGLYSTEELDGARQILMDVTGVDISAVEAEMQRKSARERETISRTIVKRLDTYVTALFTPERLKELQQRITALLEKPSDQRWVPFLMLFSGSLHDEDVVVNNKRLLIMALLSEIMRQAT